MPWATRSRRKSTSSLSNSTPTWPPEGENTTRARAEEIRRRRRSAPPLRATPSATAARRWASTSTTTPTAASGTRSMRTACCYWAGIEGRQLEMKEALFTANFTEQKSTSDHDVARRRREGRRSRRSQSARNPQLRRLHRRSPPRGRCLAQSRHQRRAVGDLQPALDDPGRPAAESVRTGDPPDRGRLGDARRGKRRRSVGVRNRRPLSRRPPLRQRLHHHAVHPVPQQEAVGSARPVFLVDRASRSTIRASCPIQHCSRTPPSR